eukprot:264911-Prymnesium_polylepis.1
MHWTMLCGSAHRNAVAWVNHHVVNMDARNEPSTATSRPSSTDTCPAITPAAMMEALKIAECQSTGVVLISNTNVNDGIVI